MRCENCRQRFAFQFTDSHIQAPKLCASCSAKYLDGLQNQPLAGGKREHVDTGLLADKAKEIVAGARQKAYGTPEDNFARIARFWTAYFQNTGRDVEITASDVSPMMRLLKEARLCDTPDHADSHIDLIGYTLTGARVNGVKIEVDDP